MRARMVSSLMVILFTSLVAAAGTVYDNGPQNIDYHYGGYGFYQRFWVSNTFTVVNSSTVSGISIWTWNWPTDHNLTAEVMITSQPNSGTVYFDQVVQFSESSCYADGFGFSHCVRAADWASGPALPVGAYWVTLKNGGFPSGNQFFWDSNNGGGCQSQGCPSQGMWNYGTIPSESFTLIGTSGGDRADNAPKTTTLLLFGSGFVGLVGLVRRFVG